MLLLTLIIFFKKFQKSKIGKIILFFSALEKAVNMSAFGQGPPLNILQGHKLKLKLATIKCQYKKCPYRQVGDINEKYWSQVDNFLD